MMVRSLSPEIAQKHTRLCDLTAASGGNQNALDS